MESMGVMLEPYEKVLKWLGLNLPRPRGDSLKLLPSALPSGCAGKVSLLLFFFNSFVLLEGCCTVTGLTANKKRLFFSSQVTNNYNK